jgi:hypothetical protein
MGNTITIGTETMPTVTQITTVQKQQTPEGKKSVDIPTQTQETSPQVTPTPILTNKVVKVEISSEMFGAWYEVFWEEELLIRIPPCSERGCSGEEIIKELGYAFSNEELWITVKDGRFFYAHSGWDPIKGPDFGDPFRRVVNNNSDITLCMDNNCYQMIAYVKLSREESTKPVFVNDLFESINDDDIFIITCDYGIIPNQISPKIIVQLQPIN